MVIRTVPLVVAVTVLPQFKDKKTAVRIARETESQISLYLFTATLINLGLTVTATVLLVVVSFQSTASPRAAA